MLTTCPNQIECVAEPERAAILLAAPRLDILRVAREPVSAARIAEQLGMVRQKVGYHVRTLAKAKFLLRAGERKKRNMIEQRYVASAESYMLAPEILGPLAVDERDIKDMASAAYLMALSARLQTELNTAITAARRNNQRVATLSMNTALRFASAGQRAEFAHALRDAVADVVARFSEPMSKPDGSAGDGRPYRLVLGCHPIPGHRPAATNAREE